MKPVGNVPKRDKRVPYSGGGTAQTPNNNSKKRSPVQKTNVKKKGGGKRSNRMKLRLGIWCILFFIVVIGIYAATKKNGGEVLVGEQVVGILNESKTKAEDLTKTVTAQLVSELGSNVKINEVITVKPIHVPGARKKEVATLDYLLPKIRKAVTYSVEAGVIMVQDEKVAVLSNVTEAEAVLTAIKDEYKREGVTLEITFVEKVAAISQFVDSTEIITKEVAQNKLKESTEIQKTYTVEPEDTLDGISKKVNMTTEKLLQQNEGLTISSKLKIGQVLKILAQKPFVSVKTVETVVMTEVEPKKYVTQEDSTKNKGYKKVIQQGRDGQKESTKQIIRINTLLEEEKEISKKVIVEPVDEIILQGTK